MDKRIKGNYSSKEWEICRHYRIFSSVHRILIIDILLESNGCRVTKLVMETGLSHRQVYYQLSVLRRIGYVYCTYHKGRYLVRFAGGWHNFGQSVYEGIKMLSALAKNRGSRQATHLRIERQ